MQHERITGGMDFEDALEYEPPEVVDCGGLAELTAGETHGHHLDSAFHAGAHFEHPTFSS